MEIRTAAPQDLPAVTRLEALCFPPAEAAPKAAFRDRLAACPQTCWLLWEGDTLLAMVNGMTVQTPDLTDAMYETTALHDPAGPWLMIFGVDTHPDHRRRGYAGRLLRHAIQAARDQGAGGGGAH
ncbi:MAG: GNAT family N-acetyltransferase, partial [Evtepia gabavorous]